MLEILVLLELLVLLAQPELVQAQEALVDLEQIHLMFNH